MSDPTVKFIRAHQATITAGANGCVLYWMKLLYEFWGFCVNGGSDLKVPGGFATISGSLAPNYLSMAPTFESGTAVLLASGSDGSTSYGTDVFTAPSVDWTSGSMVGKWLVTWKSGSTSTDDSVYPIVKVIGSQSIRVDVCSGGTPMSSSKNELRFGERSSVNFRVVDFAAAHALVGYASGNYLILQFDASIVNVGQTNSQARIGLASTSDGMISRGTIALSASGSWNGTSFSDLGPELIPDGGGFSTYSWANNSNGTTYFTFWGDRGGIVTHAAGSIAQSPSWFHIEVPRRLFTGSRDPNPICCANVGKIGLLATNFVTAQNWSAGWMVHNPLDNVSVRRYMVMVRNVGGHNATFFYGSTMGPVTERNKQSFYNVTTRKFVVQDVVLSHRATSNSYTMGRCQLRLTAFASGPYQANTKLGQRGEWISVGGGVLWPWDNAQMPQSLFPVGV